jgi:hypothetical protein
MIVFHVHDFLEEEQNLRRTQILMPGRQISVLQPIQIFWAKLIVIKKQKKTGMY